MNAPAASAIEAQFDGLVGPTHHYAGLARGNRASALNAAQVSNPREAALQGLAKMRALADLGVAQGFFPPQERPHLPSLRALGLRGSPAEILQRVQRQTPELLSAVSSASSMWAANAATVSPAADTADGRVHFTPANLASHRHRALETAATARLLRTVFADPEHFVHHEALPATPAQADEGAANHLRLACEHGAPGLEVFVHGRSDATAAAPVPARQTRAAGEAIARAHRLAPARTLHLAQDPRAIAAGAFHNDVVAVGNRHLLLHHACAFVDEQALHDAARAVLDVPPCLLRVRESELSLDEAVRSYLFNSQVVDLPGEAGMWLICASECEEQARAWTLVQRWVQDPDVPIRGVTAFDLRQSMRNGGGPACLRLRVVLSPAQRAAVRPCFWLDADRHARLEDWVRRHYRDRLEFGDLADPALLMEGYTALDRLTQILGLGSFYEFQR